MMRIGAVNYLNSKPLVHELPALAPNARITYDLPSRLADSLAAGRLDVALVPSVELFRAAGHRIVSDACVACRGPVLSVKLHFRVPPPDVRTVALDEGSRTSAALTQILLAETCGVRPAKQPLPIGCGPETTDADAVLLIGDRAISNGEWGVGSGESNPRSADTARRVVRNPQFDRSRNTVDFVEVWDLGERWCQWTGLPFVFAMWLARGDVDVTQVRDVLNAARDRGLQNLEQIAAHEAPLVGISRALAETYLRDNLHFELGRPERAGLRRFYELCVQHDLAPRGLERTLEEFAAVEPCRK